MNALALHTPAANTPPLRGESGSVGRIESIFQREIANILTGAVKYPSGEDISRKIAEFIKYGLKIPGEVRIKVTLTREDIVGTLSFEVPTNPPQYLYISGIPKNIQKETKKFLKRIEIQIKNAIDSWEENYRDELTGLYNEKFLTPKKASLDEKGGNYGIMYFDAIGLRKLNNKYGHAIGDKLIIEFSQILKDTFGERKEVSIIRHGGDEFIVIIGMSDETATLEIKEQMDGYASILQKKILKLQHTKRRYSIDAKIGASIHVIGQNDKKSEDIIGEADPKGKKPIQKLSQALPIGFFDTKNLRMRQIKAQVQRFLDENIAV